MNKFLTTILIYCLTITSVMAGLPPTSAKGSGVASYVTVFKTDYSVLPVSSSGTTLTFGSKASLFDALSPMTTSGDLIRGGTSGTGTRLAIGSNGDYLTVTAGVPAWTSVSPNTIKIATISDVKSAGTSGGTFTSGAWQTRTLNTLSDPTSIVTSLSANQFVLPAGTYYIDAFVPANQVNAHIAKLYNITDSSDVMFGGRQHSASSAAGNHSSRIVGSFTIAGSKTFEIRHWSNSTEAGDGFGYSSGSLNGASEIYTTISLQKM